MNNLGLTTPIGLYQDFTPDILLGIEHDNQDKSPMSRIDELVNDINFILKDIIGKDGKKISALVTAIFNNSSEVIKQTEYRIRELLIDHHGTFSLFLKGLDVACAQVSKGEKVSVELYISDISHPDFLETLKNRKDQGFDPKLLILEIRSEDCGVIDSRVMENLNILGELGFHFSLNGFIMVGNEIKSYHLEKLKKIKKMPLYLRISRNIFDKIYKGTSEAMKKFLEQIRYFRDKGVDILIGNSSISSETLEEATKPPLSFLEKSDIRQEEILDIYGRCHAKECLFLPGDAMKVPQALEILMSENMTGDLLRMQIKATMDDIIQGERKSFNVYIKDIGSVDFHKTIDLIMVIPRNKRSGVIFELLEVKYGSMNEQVLSNLRFLQKEGFAIAIDDLLLGYNTTSMSKEILFTLQDVGIYLDYIKIDGSVVMAIRNGTLLESEKGELKQLIQLYSKLSEKTIFILEWIQDVQHAIRSQKLLTTAKKNREDDKDFIIMNPAKILFQGMNINSGNFGISQGKDMSRLF